MLSQIRRMLKAVLRPDKESLQAHADEIRASGLFSSGWYLRQYPDVARAGMDPVVHYILHGAAEGRDPSPSFSTRRYMEGNSYASRNGLNPLLHFVRSGGVDGRLSAPEVSERMNSPGGAVVDYSYFDESYFQDGEKRGTAYRLYLQNSVQNLAWREIAEHIVNIFGAKRTLEIGCATGMIVKHLNEMGVDAHGVDVSEWAVENRAHPNVTLCPAEKLPFRDASFDVVYSCGAMEHLPPAVRDAGLAQLGRVCRRDGYQFHMIPIVGEGPYRGDRAHVIEGLSHDKTHFNLFDRDEWLRLFGATGWKDTGLKLAFRHDTESYELSWCHLILRRSPVDDATVRRVMQSNIAVASALFHRDRELMGRQFNMTDGEASVFNSQSAIEFTGDWKNEVAVFDPPIDLSSAMFRLHVFLDATQPAALRCGFISSALPGESEDAHMLETWKEFAPGYTVTHLRRSDLGVLRGSPDMGTIAKIVFGGNPGNVRVRVSLVALQRGRVRQLIP